MTYLPERNKNGDGEEETYRALAMEVTDDTGMEKGDTVTLLW